METVAYLILAHSPNEPLRLLIQTLLEDERSLVYVHLDLKCGPKPGLEINHRRLRLMQDYAVNWAGFSQVRAIKSLLQVAYEDESNQRFVTLSGSCFPLKPISDVNNTLLASCEPLFSIWGEIDRNKKSTGMGRYTITKYYAYDRAWINPKRSKVLRLIWIGLRFLNNIAPYERHFPRDGVWKGSMHFVADRALTKELISSKPDLEEELNHTASSDETYFATIYGRERQRMGLPILVTDFDSEMQGTHFIRKRRERRSTLSRLLTTVDLRLLKPQDVPDALHSGALFARKCNLEIVKLIRQALSELTAADPPLKSGRAGSLADRGASRSAPPGRDVQA